MVDVDIAICGGGTAGSVLAGRLSAEGRSVALIEAGASVWSREVLDAHQVPRGNDWGLRSEPIPNSNGRTIPLPRPRLLGGSSTAQLGLALWPLAADLNRWVESGLTSWRFEDVLPYLQRMEDDQEFPVGRHGQTGPMPVRRTSPADLLPIQRAFLATGEELGYRRIIDFNGSDADGVGLCPLSTSLEGRRWNAAAAYLPRTEKSNLQILSNCLIDKLILTSERVTGIQIIDSERRVREVRCRRAVLCAGTYGNPGILTRSGIGPTKVLAQLGAQQIVGSPVGMHLQDHPVISMAFLLKPGVGHKNDPFFQTLLRFCGSGAAPDVHILPRSSSWKYHGLPKGRMAFLVFVGLMRPHSFGSVQVRSMSCSDAPRIETGFMTDPRDGERLLEGVRVARKLAATKPIAEMIESELSPGHRLLDSDSSISLANLLLSYHHPVGTCRMSASDDGAGVVDETLSVRGVENLKIADASIMPTIPSSNTMASVLMIAERCTDFIRDEWAS